MNLGNRILRTCAAGMPIKDEGLDCLKQSTIRLIPMPGSTTTGTAPALKRAKVRVKKSRLGLTIRIVRVPRVIPALSRPQAR